MSFKSYTITLAVCAVAIMGFQYLQAEALSDMEKLKSENDLKISAMNKQVSILAMRDKSRHNVKKRVTIDAMPEDKPHVSWVDYANSEGW